MNAAHWHLILNHIPILGTLFGLLLLTYALLGRKSEEVRTGLAKASLSLFVIVGLSAGAVYLTGEEAEEAVEHLPGVSEALIEPHEEVAFYALVAAIVLGVVALGGLIFLRGRAVPGWLSALMLGLALVTSGVTGYTAYLGGKINHPEIRADQETPPAGSYEDD